MLNLFYLLAGGAIGYIINSAAHAAGKQRPTVTFTVVKISGIQITGEINKMELREGQKAVITVNLLTKGGHPAKVEDGSARFTSSDESVVSVEQNPENPLEATIRGLDGSANESVVVTFQGDADLDPGEGDVREVVGTLAVTCTTGEAVTVEITAGTPTDDAEVDGPAPDDEPAPVEDPLEHPATPEPAEDPAPPAEETPAEEVPAEPAEGDGKPGGNNF